MKMTFVMVATTNSRVAENVSVWVKHFINTWLQHQFLYLGDKNNASLSGDEKRNFLAAFDGQYPTSQKLTILNLPRS